MNTTTSIQLKPYGYIYKLTNKINNKCYIGQSTNNPESGRWNKYKRLQCKGQPKLYNALKKYGPDNFIFEIIAIGLNKEDLDLLEDLYENYYNSIFNGYNIRCGGSRGKHSQETKIKLSISHVGHKHSKETKIKMSNSQLGHIVSEKTKRKLSIKNTGYKHSEEAKIKMSEKQKGVGNHMLGKRKTETTKQRISESRKGMIFTEEHKRKISESRKGQLISKETKRKMSNSHKKQISRVPLFA